MYILGNGVLSIGGTDIALTRGGGQFVIERTIKTIVADGDYGPVKGRIRVDGEVATLTMNVLEIISANMDAMYPAMDVDTTSTPGTAAVTGTLDIVTGDYNDVVWTGEDESGNPVVITLDDAINLENLDWTMVDKDEIVDQLKFTATYDSTTRTTPPWTIEFIDAD